MKNRSLLLTCYRSLLRWADRCEGAPIRIKSEHLGAVCPAAADNSVVINDAATFRNFVQWQFRRRDTAGSDAGDPVEKAFTALRLLNTKYEPVLQALEEERRVHTDRKGIKFRVGEVVQHSQQGYRAVVTGWDRVCENVNLLEDTDVNFVQPFYRVITDDDSMLRSHGQKRWFQYLPQDEVEILKSPKHVTSMKINEYFDGYSPQLGRYIPKRHIQWEYPDEYMASDVQPCSQTMRKIRKPSSVLRNTSRASEKGKARRKEKVARKSDEAKSGQAEQTAKSALGAAKNVEEPAVKSVTEK
ncbi:hypothetical protein BSKO_00427 [Bryopsis sp. KO-2023]|nr:hypothetical protein BSKO_00427 [Bryopsis sp. KO-2023]